MLHKSLRAAARGARPRRGCAVAPPAVPRRVAPCLSGSSSSSSRALSTQPPPAEAEALPASPSWAIGRALVSGEQSGALDALMARAEQGVLYAKLMMLERNEIIDFDAAEFALGAAHARHHIYSLVSGGDLDELRDTVSPAAISALRDAAAEQPERFSSPAPIGARVLFVDATCVAEERLSPAEQQVHTLGISVQFLHETDSDDAPPDADEPAQDVESVWTFERQVEFAQPVVADEMSIAEADGDWIVVGLELKGDDAPDGGE